MKKCTLFFLMMAASFAVLAQTQKGDWMVGGHISWNSTKGNSDFTIQPMGGYFFFDNFAAGTQLLLSYAKNGDARNNAWGFGPFARYYFTLKNTAVFKPLVHASYTFEHLATKTAGVKTKTTVNSFYFAGGATYFINRNVAIEGLAGYNRSSVSDMDSRGGFRLEIGFQIYLLNRQVRSLINSVK